MEKFMKGIGVITLLFVTIWVAAWFVDEILLPPHKDAAGNSVWIGETK